MGRLKSKTCLKPITKSDGLKIPRRNEVEYENQKIRTTIPAFSAHLPVV